MGAPVSGPTEEERPGKPVLLTFTLSHFCEKARWALERYGVEYEEEPHGPPFHAFAVRRAGGKGTVPCLKLPAGSSEGSCVDGSASILRWIDERRPANGPSLFPAPHEAEVAELCERLDAKLGPAVRKWNFANNLHLPEFWEDLTAQPVPAYERTITLGGRPIFRMFAAAQEGITADTAKTSFQDVKAVFDDVSDRLADGRRYLVGDTLTAADITFASLTAVILGQPYGRSKGLLPGVSEQTKADVACLRQTKAGAYALRLWEEDRGTVFKA